MIWNSNLFCESITFRFFDLKGHIYTFNTDLKNRLRKFAARYPELCKLKAEDKELGCMTYIVQKSRVSIHLNSPQSEARRKAASENARRTMNLVFGNAQDYLAKTKEL